MERALIEEEVLNDLADHPTVEYIRRLEDERTCSPHPLHLHLHLLFYLT